MAAPVLLCATGACGVNLDLGSNDAGVAYDADCLPGTYTGTYHCMVASGTPITLAASGTLSIVLGPSGAHTLALAQDASLVGMISGIMTDTALSGQLDCSTKQLTGHDGPTAFSTSTIGGTVGGTGMLGAVYDGDASPPQLVDGVLDSPAALGSTCTWTATRGP